MKILIKVLLFVLLLFLVYCGLCYFGPKDFNTNKSKTIDAPASIVYNMVNDIREWESWSAWELEDTTMKVQYSENTVGTGAYQTWESKKSGNGKQEIVANVKNTSIRTKLNFDDFGGDNFANWTFSNDENNKTNVTWDFEGQPLPFLVRGLMMVMGAKKQMENNYVNSLNNLAKLAEDRHKGIYNGYKINMVDMPQKYFVMSRQSVKSDEVEQFYRTNLGSLFTKVQGKNVELDGNPCGLFFNKNGNNLDMAAAIPIKTELREEGLSTYSIEPKKALQIDYYGSYDNLASGHNAMAKFIRDRGYFQDAPVIEQYVTDPTTEQDPGKWLTKITYYYSTQ